MLLHIKQFFVSTQALQRDQRPKPTETER